MLTSQPTLPCMLHAALHPGGYLRCSCFPSIVHPPAHKAPGQAQDRRCRSARARASSALP